MSQNILQYESKVWSTADLLIGAGIKQSDFPKYMMPYFAMIMLESRLVRHYKELLKDFGAETIDDIVLVDVLPHVGDRGVVANNEFRESTWRPTFTATTLSDLQAYVAGISGATLYFTTECEPCLNADLGTQVPDLATCSTPNWSTSAPATVSDVCAFKIEYGTTFEFSRTQFLLRTLRSRRC